MAFDFVGHEESYKLRNFLKTGIFDTNYADVIHKIIFGTPIDFSRVDRRNYYNTLRLRRINAYSTIKTHHRLSKYNRQYQYKSGRTNRRRYR